MIKEISIKNYKSILSEKIELGRTNVFIGENGCGKTNILEAIAFYCAAKTNELSHDNLFNRGIRVTKPNITFSSFVNNKAKNSIQIDVRFSIGNIIETDSAIIKSSDPNDIYSKWYDFDELKKLIEKYINDGSGLEVESKELIKNLKLIKNDKILLNEEEFFKYILDSETIKPNVAWEILKGFLIYNLNSNALIGIYNISKKLPLGIHGEGLDLLLAKMSEDEIEEMQSLSSLGWIKDIITDKNDLLKFEGHKLGRSTSNLYFTDKYMKRGNNILSAENANEGALFILFYLSLFISKRTPSVFAIDNIETALNPKLCRDLIKVISNLSKRNSKQVFITTHNPAVLDGLNLNDETQKLFIVKRNDAGQTKVEELLVKPNIEEKGLKLSEMWMRGYLGGLSNNNF
jgi:AAA15 family ATPase/GTPase